jgi:hypothetical protein
MSMKWTHRQRYSTAPLAGTTRWASILLGGLALLTVSDAAAQIGGQTGTVPGFPQFYESCVERDCDRDEQSCKVQLGLVPANSLFMATDIMCHAFVSEEVGIGLRAKFTLREEKSGKEILKNIFVVADVSPPSGGRKREYIPHESLLSFFAPGSRPIISLTIVGIPQIPGTPHVECKLAGNLVRRQ